MKVSNRRYGKKNRYPTEHLNVQAKARTTDDLVPAEHDFKGNLEDWEDRVFVNAIHFRLHRFYGRGETDRIEVKTFPEALALAQVELEQNKRVLIYAVTEAERFIACVQKRWDHYSKLWEKAHGTPSR